MSQRFLDRLFSPRSIAVIGASSRVRHVGHVVMRNLLTGGFEGPVLPVNPRHNAIAGVLCYRDIASLPLTPDLAIICTRRDTVPGLIEELGARGTRMVIVMASNLATTPGSDGRMLEILMLEAARRHGVRILGASSLGVMAPKKGLNATFSPAQVRPGPIAFVSQSDAVGMMVLDWAASKKIGFSHVVSIGDGSDIGFGEVLDFLGGDAETRAIVLYLESIRDRPTFMAAARAASRNKPVLAIKAGRSPRNPLQGISDPLFLDVPSLISSDDVYGAAMRRAGILRVEHIDELFGAVETLARSRPMIGERLVAISNGGGAGVMVEDCLHTGGYSMPALAPESIERLRVMLPGWRGGNPIDIPVDADAQTYARVLRVLREKRDGDVILLMHTPTALTSSSDTAQAVIDVVRELGGNLLSCWVGTDSVSNERKLLLDAGIASFDTPSHAAQAFLHMLSHRRNRETLLQTPPSVPVEFQPDIARVREIIQQTLMAGKDRLAEPDAKAIFAAYGIPVVQTHLAATPAAAADVARQVGLPVAVTITSPDIRRKWAIGGVALNLETPEAVEAAARGMIERAQALRPDARISGFTVQKMVPRGYSRQLIIGVATDPLFGPVILFGEGGRGVELYRDLAVALPPLNQPLARDLISRTRAATLLDAHHDHPAADLDKLALTLTQVSQLIVDHPEIVELDINPLFADDRGVIAVDGHIRLSTADVTKPFRLSIRPYPKELEEVVRLRDQREVLFRPIRPEDEPGHYEFHSRLKPEDIRYRFFRYVDAIPHSEMARMTQIDYDREMAFVAVIPARPGGDGPQETLGVVRAISSPDNDDAEFAIIIRSDLKGCGLGSALMRKMIAYCRTRGTRRLAGEVLSDNDPMIKLMRALGFDIRPTDEGGVVSVTLNLQDK
jgi:acetyltransferase